MEFLSTSEIAKKWDISRRRVTTLCIEGRIDGAVHKYYSVLPRIEIRLKYMNMVYNKHQFNSIVNRTDYDESFDLQYFH